MAIAFVDSDSAVATASATAETGTLTVSGSDTMAIVGVLTSDSLAAITAVKWGGSGGTDMGAPVVIHDGQGFMRIAIYKLANPGNGLTAHITSAATMNEIYIGATTWSGCSSTVASGGADDDQGFGTGPSLSVATSAGQVVVDIAALVSDNITAVQTLRTQLDIGDFFHFGMQSAAHSVSPAVMAWIPGGGSAANWHWAQVAVVLSEAAADTGIGAQRNISSLVAVSRASHF